MFFTYSAHQTTYENLLKTRLILELKFDPEIEIFKVKGVCGNFFTIFYVFSASSYIRKPSKNLAYIRNKIWPWIDDFQGRRCLRGFFFTIFFIFSAWNYIEIPSQTFMTNETSFLHCTLRCLRGWSIYRPAVRSGTLTEISRDFRFKFCIS